MKTKVFIIFMIVYSLLGCGASGLITGKKMEIRTSESAYLSDKQVIDLKNKVENGDFDSMNKLADFYYEVENNFEKASRLYEMAAKSGDPSFQLNYAQVLLSLNDHGKKQQAIVWLKQASESGLAKAQEMLAEEFEKGELIKKDEQKAYFWFQKAALQKRAFSINKIIQFYLKGIGTSKDIKKAYLWAMIYSTIVDPRSINGKKNLEMIELIIAKLNYKTLKMVNKEFIELYWELQQKE